MCLRYDNDVHQSDRITMNPEVMGGKPCIRGMRVTVGMIVGAMSVGRTIVQLLAEDRRPHETCRAQRRASSRSTARTRGESPPLLPAPCMLVRVTFRVAENGCPNGRTGTRGPAF